MVESDMISYSILLLFRTDRTTCRVFFAVKRGLIHILFLTTRRSYNAVRYVYAMDYYCSTYNSKHLFSIYRLYLINHFVTMERLKPC